MKKVHLCCIGKANKFNDSWMQQALEEYEKRLSREYQFFYSWFKSDEDLVKFLKNTPSGKILALNSQGSQFTSENWAQFIDKLWATHGLSSPLFFIIGGADGFTEVLKNFIREEKIQQISFSQFTFTHQMIRVILLEQIYRAYCISSSIPYHRA